MHALEDRSTRTREGLQVPMLSSVRACLQRAAVSARELLG